MERVFLKFVGIMKYNNYFTRVFRSKSANVHVGSSEKFIQMFVKFIEENDMCYNNRFYLFGGDRRFSPAGGKVDVLEIFQIFGSINVIRLFLIDCYRSEKIVVHGLFSGFFIILMFFQPWLWKKVYWVIWGGDLYACTRKNKSIKLNIKEFCKRIIIPRFGFLLTYIGGDIDLARKWYGAKGKAIDCIMYSSNTSTKKISSIKSDARKIILAGNSADPSNNHREIFRRLRDLEAQNFNILCPLSYGDEIYREEIVKYGRALFGKRFTPLLTFLDPGEYFNEISRVDIVVFAHERQQGMGNLINLLGMGKKVFIKETVSSFEVFKNLGVKIFGFNELDLGDLKQEDLQNNIYIINKNFNNDVLVRQWKKILN